MIQEIRHSSGTLDMGVKNIPSRMHEYEHKCLSMDIKNNERLKECNKYYDISQLPSTTGHLTQTVLQVVEAD